MKSDMDFLFLFLKTYYTWHTFIGSTNFVCERQSTWSILLRQKPITVVVIPGGTLSLSLSLSLSHWLSVNKTMELNNNNEPSFSSLHDSLPIAKLSPSPPSLLSLLAIPSSSPSSPSSPTPSCLFLFTDSWGFVLFVLILLYNVSIGFWFNFIICVCQIWDCWIWVLFWFD